MKHVKSHVKLKHIKSDSHVQFQDLIWTAEKTLRWLLSQKMYQYGLFTEHTYMPTPKLSFQGGKNHQTLQHSIIFRNTSANVSPHLWNNSSYQISRENHRAILHLTPPLLILYSRKWCLLIMLDFLPVQSFHNSSGNFKFQASLFSSTVMKSHFSWRAIFDVWKHLLFTRDGFAGMRSIDSAMLSLAHETFIHMAPWFWRPIRLAA